MKTKYIKNMVTFIFFFILFGSTIKAESSSCKVLVVMSYEETNPWCQEIKEGIDSILADYCEIKYFYMNTKRNIKGGPKKAKEAFTLYKKLQPDGVIAADDPVQSMFVVPYLKNKVKTPVMFNGVNAESDQYGYPASNISGILERSHTRESIAFAKQLIPSINTVGFIARDSLSGRSIQKQVQNESDTYPAKLIDFKLVKTIKQALTVIKDYREKADLIGAFATNGLLDDNGNPLDNKQVTNIITKAFGKPMIGANKFHVRFGALCSVIKTGQTQGRVAAEMLLKAMQGTPVSDLPITVNKHGKRMINATVMRSLGIEPKRRMLIGAELVKTTE
jgi:ABC-type uncharacterized transport system substrate-binding protein